MTKRELVIIGIAIIALCSAIYGWYHPRVIEQASEPITLPGKTVYRIKDCKPEGAKPLPDGDIPLVSSNLPPASNGGTILTTLNPSTGEVHNQFTAKDLPFWSFENEKRVKIISNGTGGILQAVWSFARVGNVYLSADAFAYNITGQSGAYIGAGLEYRF